MSVFNIQANTLYVVATPIGNLGDISQRAIEVLEQVDVIACEDTRHTQKLLTHLGIKNRTMSLHDHNERQRQQQIADLLGEGKSVALVSDAGTPLISDPGFHVVRHLREQNLTVTAIPGACAAITALSISGLPTDRFTFEGFLPAKSGARKSTLSALAHETRTMVFYDAPRRAIDTIKDVAEVFGDERQVVIARELTKTFETVTSDSAGNLVSWLEQDSNQLKGEMVLIIEGAQLKTDSLSPEAEQLASLLAVELPPKKASAIVAEVFGLKKKQVYEYLLNQ